MEEFKQLGRTESVPARTEIVIGPGPSTYQSSYRPASLEPESEGLLVEYYRLLLRHRVGIAVLAAVGAALALLLCLTTRPIYRARTSLDIQNLNVDFMNIRNIAPTGGLTGAGSGEVFLQTQIKLLQSDSLLSRTKKRLQPEAAAIRLQNHGWLAGARQLLQLPGSQPPTVEETLDYTTKSLAVKPMGLTHIVEITCDSWDARFAAAFCNGLSSEFQMQDREVRWSEAEKTSEWLSRQLADVRDQLSTSEKRLEHASQANGLILGQQNGSVSEQRLRELQTELMKAQADRVARQAQYEISKSASADSLPSVLDDSQLRDYQTRLVELRRQLADLVPPLTDAHPKVQHVKAQIRELESSLAAKKVNVVERMQNEYAAAKHREDLLTSAYLNQERRVAVEMGRETQYNMLRRDVDSGQQLYQTLSQRVKEAGLASAMQASTIRTVDPAVAPRIPILPKKVQTVVVGIVLGTIAGILFAFFKDRTETVLRTPGEAPRYLNVRELGVIPSARVGLSQAYLRRIQQGSSSTGALQVVGSTLPAGKQMRSEQVVDLATWKAHASLVAEAYRSATYSILLEGKQSDRGKVYVITSPSAGEGKTSVTCNLGIALAQANRRVLVIDGDLRRPRLHKSMGISNEVGFRDLLRGEGNSDGRSMNSYCQPSQVPNMFILPSGTGVEEPSGLLHSSRLGPLLERLTREFDIVLIDSPPVLHLADARILAGATDGVILVLRARSTDRETAMSARDLFHHDNARIVGTILNDFDPLSQGKTGYYDSYYRYAGAAAKGSGDLNPA